ncbi:SDR family NAD(P)-dependent oxidoreductase [Thalassococcus sp. S3]|uniref:SDR family NAD(P)-dependent oxidoreductase n=1 Tax=Thalassococcus sp. S3 TaxID=2017482 RepID=UPI0010248259|nr:SDR family oxidoreductase [Thalassococcus sp. S3]QBF31295.1 3-hydroxyacyl-CoA dehydrogenase [Thalassococcus sp. S3]
MTLSGKHALITGGGTGIGLAIAKALAAEGAQVTITGRRQEVLDEVATDGMTGMAMDVRDEDDVVGKITTAVEARGPIQICVANAGLAEGRATHKTTMDFWRNMMATNLDGAFLTLREAMTSMRQTDWGRVITIASIAGVRGLPGASCYTASKHGLIGLTRAMSEEYIGTNYTFNALCPAYVDTPIITRNTENIAQRTDLSEEDARNTMIKTNRHKRLIAPEEIASAALWLCQPGSESVNGQAIEIAGGQM